MKKFTVSALALAAFALPVVADTKSTMEIDPSTMIVADDITGGNIYTDLSDVPWKDDGPIDAAVQSWKAIGEIEDIVLNSSGQMVGIVADVGGFLGIGDKHVLLPMENVRIVPLVDGDDDYALVTRHTEESLMGLPEVEKGWFE
ncbi:MULTISPECIES: PRC-barrel domain-containing protein [unclassified Meridianimarinicoccus]|uniref:PRC-barrel domain-containing protein n=1 Tax=unclassified Meridianimarinicoccus TaxID=2923344 RepID=UPI0018675935|nr:PRC-barrel domain-containing protein [Fluviibacterium sp. MJW13]